MSVVGRLEAFIPVPAAAFSVQNSAGTFVVTLTPDTYTVTALIAHLLACLTAQAAPSSGAWTVTLSTGATGTGLVTINCTGTWSITWTSTELRDLLGFTGNIAAATSSRTGGEGMRGLWLPGCHLVCDDDPSSAPEVSDARALESPGGATTVLVGTYRYEHRNILWSHVAHAKVREHAAATPNTSWDAWVRDTQIARGHSWFSPGTPFLVYFDDAGTETALGAELGADGPATGWTFSPALRGTTGPTRSFEYSNAWWAVRIDRLVTEG